MRYHHITRRILIEMIQSKQTLRHHRLLRTTDSMAHYQNHFINKLWRKIRKISARKDLGSSRQILNGKKVLELEGEMNGSSGKLGRSLYED